VHALLDEDPRVESYRLGGQGEGSWGATLVCLHDPGS
jgi:dsDNA-specific endonuclease/ATPase MutS2